MFSSKNFVLILLFMLVGVAACGRIVASDHANSARDSFTPQTVPLATIEQMLKSLLGPKLHETAPGKFAYQSNSQKHGSLEFDHQNGRVLIVGDHSLCDQFVRLVDAIDQPKPPQGRDRQFIPIRAAKADSVSRILEINRAGRKPQQLPMPQPPGQRAAPLAVPQTVPRLELRPDTTQIQPAPAIQQVQYQFEDAPPVSPPLQAGVPANGVPANVEVVNDFRYMVLPELDVVVVDATPAEAERIKTMIREIEEMSKMAEPQIEVVYLRNVNCISLNYVIRQVYVDLFRTKQGTVTFMPMINPNAMLLVGWGNSMQAMKELIETLDKPVAAENSLLKVFQLKHAAAQTVLTTLNATFPPLQGAANAFAPNLRLVADQRTNSLIVQAGANDMKEIEQLLAQMDVPGGGTKLQIRHFKLKHTLAADTAKVLTEATTTGAQGGKKPALELLIHDEKGKKLIASGIMEEVRISADARNNTVIVTAPEHAMPLIEELLGMIDMPSATAEVKIFPVLFGDAEAMVITLKALIPSQMEGQTGPELPGLPAAKDEETLIPIRFAVDTRTNCILAVGSANDLKIVEALLFSLDREDQQARKSSVYPLKSVKADAISLAINKYITDRRAIQNASPGVISPYQQIESEVIVIPELTGNKLIVSATPRYYDEIIDLIQQIDVMPPQVVIQVLIGEVALGNTKEFGAEFGFQDSLLFNRSTFNNITEGTRTITRTENGVTTVIEEPVITNGSVVPGWLFNEDPSHSLGNGYNTNSAQGVGNAGSQLLTNFGTGRVGAETGFGGMVFSANSDAVSVMIRALQETNRLEILSRPQITAMNNEKALIHVGQLVPRSNGTNMTSYGYESDIEDKEVGLKLMVMPNISPDGNVVMMVSVEKSKVGREADGVVISTNENGVVRSPMIDRINAVTMINAADNETVVLGGLISKEHQDIKRKVPLLGDIPVVGKLFRYDYTKTNRNELLVILTPRIVRNSADMEAVKQIEAARMNWCIGNVAKVHGDIGVYSAVHEQPYAGDATVVHPDVVEMETLTPLEDADPKKIPIPTLAPAN